MRPQSFRFAGLRLTAAGGVALAALIVACQAELPTDHAVSEMDAGKMARVATMGHMIGDSIRFKVDGQIVDGVVAQLIAPDQIATVKVEHSDSAGGPAWVAVTTKKGALTLTNKVPYMRKAEDGAGGVTAEARVMENAHETIGYSNLRIVSSDQKEGFHGLLFIDGKRADPSEFLNLDHTALKSVEVIKGPEAQKLYKDPAAAFGVIKVVTK